MHRFTITIPTAILTRNAAYFNNHNHTNYTCLHSQFNTTESAI